ncbi:hypothetical protein BC827DRAFT_1270889 [Russula dissimulans]|nr:hypothetical protein BC827DRAFT_1270889 [Russula dissimulans]
MAYRPRGGVFGPDRLMTGDRRGMKYIYWYRCRLVRHCYIPDPLAPSQLTGTMVNFRDPAEIAQDQLVVTKLWHAMAGLYMWEFVTTLDYEWSIIRGHRPYSRTIWIYSLTRMAALMGVILSLVGGDVTTPYNCEIETVFQLVFGYLAVASASFLIVLRIIAIWNKKKIITVVATTVWAINVLFLIHGAAQIRSTWSPDEATCLVLNIESNKPNFIVALCTDIVLLVIMLVGLLRLGFHERSAFGMGRLMWRQGLIWLLIATLAEVPTAVFICLDLNDPYNYMFTIISMIAMSIAATRTHRQLADFVTVRSDFSSNRLMPSKPASFFPQNHTGIAIHTTSEQHQTPLSSHSGSFMSAAEQLHDKSAGLRLDRDDDVERRGPT